MKRGFHITTCHADRLFAPLQAIFCKHVPGGSRINIKSENEHVLDTEGLIIFVREITRSIRHSLPFNKIPKLLTIYIFFTVVVILNYFPVKV